MIARTVAAALVCWLAGAPIAQAGTADPRGCATTGDANAVVERREAFNAAIRDADLTVVEDVLAEKVVLVAGSRSDQFLGRDVQRELWRTEFEENPERMVYVRTPECVAFSEVGPMAMEYGRWHGQGKGETFAAGLYTAKWRRIDGAWRLEAELFMTDACGGAACPQ